MIYQYFISNNYKQCFCQRLVEHRYRILDIPAAEFVPILI